MMLARTAAGLVDAQPRLVATCPSCRQVVIPKCGPLVTWHWAHRADDCDPWSEPESDWHQQRKRRGYTCEVVMRQGADVHRADIVTPTGLVVELQAGYLAPMMIAARESFYPRLWWLYRVHWFEALRFGRVGFWWKHGAKSMVVHRCPVYWDIGPAVWRVRLGLDARGTRVLGQVLDRMSVDEFAGLLGVARAVRSA
ncbi:MAG TPA: competence protein CoiA family protein [Gemmatimonadales bacterium]|nr:competence protein CoiA family protein [Gemmatimonadales bacterium]